QQNEWYPKKRVTPESNINERRKQIYDLRLKMEKMSHIVWQEAIQANSYDLFENKLAAYIKQADSFYKVSVGKRIVQLLMKTVKNPIKMLKKLMHYLKTNKRI
ncbi:hypothetical protein TI03_06780, partial [Achromatium sp. WMS1]